MVKRKIPNDALDELETRIVEMLGMLDGSGLTVVQIWDQLSETCSDVLLENAFSPKSLAARLKKLTDAGVLIVGRHRGGTVHGRAGVKQWALAATQPGQPKPVPATSAHWGRGELQAAVFEYLRTWDANIDDTQRESGLTATQVARGVNGQVGSVAYALDKLCAQGSAALTSDKPRRYRPA